MGFFDFFRTIGKSIVKGVSSAVRFVGKIGPTISHIAHRVGKIARIVGRIPFLRAPASFIADISDLVGEGAQFATNVAGQLGDAIESTGRAR